MEELENEGPNWELTSERKANIVAAAENLKTLLNRVPKPSYAEVSDAIDQIGWENDRYPCQSGESRRD